QPGTLLRHYQELASTTQDIVSTDVPRSVLDDFVDLGFLVKEADVRSVVFDETVISPAYPDYDLMRRLVRDALVPPAPQPAPAEDDPQSTAPAPTAAPAAPAAPTSPATDVADACAYDPVQAEAALAQGKPPIRSR
ncbi:MAG TPA: LytR family transcriptional regulator, partial [Blastococcus sp.]